MYLRYTLPPGDLYEWYEDYLQDEEEIDVKAGGGQTITMGQMVYQFMTKLDWFSTLFPRVPVPIQKQIQSKIENYCKIHRVSFQQFSNPRPQQPAQYAAGRGGVAAGSAAATGEYSRSEPTSTYSNEQLDYRDRERDRRDYDYERPVEKYESRHRSERNRSKSRSPSPSRERKHKHKKHKKHKSRDRSRSRERDDRAEGSDRHKHRDRDYKRY